MHDVRRASASCQLFALVLGSSSQASSCLLQQWVQPQQPVSSLQVVAYPPGPATMACMATDPGTLFRGAWTGLSHPSEFLAGRGGE